MSAISSRAGSNGQRVNLVSPYGRTPARQATNGGTAVRTKARVTGWITRSIVVATTGFAFLDLLLLSTGGHR